MKSAFHPARHAFVSLAGALVLLSPPAGAQPQANDMPPKLEQIDEFSHPAKPATTESDPSKRGGRQIIEKRERGQITSIEVRSSDSSYYIDPSDEPGTVMPGDAQSGNTRAPQWRIFQFDLKRPAEDTNADTQAAPAAPPAPVK